MRTGDDARRDPQPGDVLLGTWLGKPNKRTVKEVKSSGIYSNVWYRASGWVGRYRSSLADWQRWAADAEVLEVAQAEEER